MNTIEIDKKITSIRLNKGLYAYIEKAAKKENRSINNYIETLLFNATNYRHPNKETKAAIDQSRLERKNLNRFSNTDSLIKSLSDEE